jgi:hypothetical protein
VQYLLQANVRLPNSSNYIAANRIINFTSTLTPQTPYLYEGPNNAVMVIQPQPGVAYDWEMNGAIVLVGAGPEFRVDDFQIQPAVVRCRARNGGMVSNWSPALNVWLNSPQAAPKETNEDDTENAIDEDLAPEELQK